MEAGEVLDDIEENESPEKKPDMFPKAISLLDEEPQPSKKPRKNNRYFFQTPCDVFSLLCCFSLAKYASLGWGDMVTTRVQTQSERDSRPQTDDHRRYEERPAYRDALISTPSKPSVSY